MSPRATPRAMTTARASLAPSSAAATASRWALPCSRPSRVAASWWLRSIPRRSSQPPRAKLAGEVGGGAFGRGLAGEEHPEPLAAHGLCRLPCLVVGDHLAALLLVGLGHRRGGRPAAAVVPVAVAGLAPLRADVDDPGAAPVVGDVGSVPGQEASPAGGDLLALVADQFVETLDGAALLVAGAVDDPHEGIGQLSPQGGDPGGG